MDNPGLAPKTCQECLADITIALQRFLQTNARASLCGQPLPLPLQAKLST